MDDYKKPTAWWRNLFSAGRLNTAEDMVYSSESRSVHRGKRRAARTEVCRPCLVWRESDPDNKDRAVVLNLNKHGFLLRMVRAFEKEDVLLMQLMRDEEFRFPLSGAIKIRVVRVTPREDGFFDHGTQTIFEKIDAFMPREPRPVVRPSLPPVVRKRTRMYSQEDEVNNSKNRRSRGY